MIQTAYESMQYSPQIMSNALCLLQVSFNILRDPQEAVTHLLGIVIGDGMRKTLRSELLRYCWRRSRFRHPAASTLAGRALPHAAAGATPGLSGMPGSIRWSRQLQQLLYEGCYCRPFGRAPPQWTSPPAPNPAFVEALSAANASRDRWDAGWQIQQCCRAARSPPSRAR